MVDVPTVAAVYLLAGIGVAEGAHRANPGATTALPYVILVAAWPIILCVALLGGRRGRRVRRR
jgi:hypothetical protein